jgi:hypothetical protein
LDTFFGGSGGGAQPVSGPPAALRFADQPKTTPARKTLPPVRVTVRDDQGNLVADFAGLVSLTIDSNPGGGSLGDSTTVAATNGIATFRHLRIDKAGNGYALLASAPGTALAPVRSRTFDILAPPTGNITVTTTTAGDPLPAGYTVTVDDSISQQIGINAVVTFVGLSTGTHVVALGGVTADCAVGGANPQTVSVTGGETAQAGFEITCAAPPPPPPPPPPPATGALTVTTTTTGSNLPAGYTVTLDGGQSATIGANDSVTATGIDAGDHTLTLSGVPANCTVTGSNPLTVTVAADATTQATFAISCQ